MQISYKLCFPFRSAEVHSRAVNSIRNLLAGHDADPRFKDSECRARVANLYLPIVGIMIDNLAKLYSWPTEGETRIVGTGNQNEHLNLILTAISDNVPNVGHNGRVCTGFYSTVLYAIFQAKGPIILREETTRHLLICFLWVIKNVERSVLRTWWTELSHNRLQTLLEILRISVSCFQYKVRRTYSFIVLTIEQSASEMWTIHKCKLSNQCSGDVEGALTLATCRSRFPASPGARAAARTSL